MEWCLVFTSSDPLGDLKALLLASGSEAEEREQFWGGVHDLSSQKVTGALGKRGHEKGALPGLPQHSTGVSFGYIPVLEL